MSTETTAQEFFKSIDKEIYSKTERLELIDSSS